MIDTALVELELHRSLQRGCALLGRPPATPYRSLQPPRDTMRQPRAAPTNALSGSRREQFLALPHVREHCDLAVAQVWARELDEGRYYCPISSTYRILRATGEFNERRPQATQPAKVTPELVATMPNMAWSWDTAAPTAASTTTSTPVSQLLIDLGVVRSHSRPHVSNDNSCSEAAFEPLK